MTHRDGDDIAAGLVELPDCTGDVARLCQRRSCLHEHDGAKVLIAEILAGSPDDEFYDAKVKVLSEMIKHHVKEEEQRDGMFAQAKKGDLDMQALGEQLAARKAELTAQFKRRGMPPPETRAMKGAELRRGSRSMPK